MTAIVDNAEAIRDRAYFLWEQAGKPCGREHEFWAEATRQIEAEQPTESVEENRNRFVAR